MQEAGQEGGKVREKVLSLVAEVNEKVKGKAFPLEYEDQGWRIVLDRSLEYPEYQKYAAGRKLLSMAVFDADFAGMYYWIPISEAPAGVTTPAMRLAELMGE